MPRLEVPIGRDGPIIDVRIWIGTEDAKTLTAGGLEIPPPFSVPGLVDTGAQLTATAKTSIRTGLPGGSPHGHVFNMILESARRRRAARSGLPPPGNEAA